MDALIECLLASVMSLLHSSNAISPHHISDKQLVVRFNRDRDRYQDLVLDLIIANKPPAVILPDSKEPSHINMQNYSVINNQMHLLGIRTITSNATQVSFRIDETKDSTKDIVFRAYGFVDRGTDDSERITVSRIDDDWGVICTPRGQAQPLLKSTIRNIDGLL
ncbi:MAG: hypothetical protein JST89_25070 [Cyanobacteria bacterium SZAS-4]|nr:hypothetical protein [Cyanobacteria bacterium SZAS-4]